MVAKYDLTEKTRQVELYNSFVKNGKNLSELAAELEAPDKESLRARIKRFRKDLAIQTRQTDQSDSDILLFLQDNIEILQEIIKERKDKPLNNRKETQKQVIKKYSDCERYNNWLSSNVKHRFKKYCNDSQYLAKDLLSSILDNFLTDADY